MEMELPNMDLFCQFLCCLKAMYCEPVKELDTFQLSHLLSEILACVFHLVCSQVRPDDMEVKVECIFFINYQSDFLITAKPLNSWKFHVLGITFWVLLFNCLLQASVLLGLGDWKCSTTSSLVTEATLQVVRSHQVRHFVSTYQKRLVIWCIA